MPRLNPVEHRSAPSCTEGPWSKAVSNLGGDQPAKACARDTPVSRTNQFRHGPSPHRESGASEGRIRKQLAFGARPARPKIVFSRRPVPAGFPRFRLRPVGCRLTAKFRGAPGACRNRSSFGAPSPSQCKTRMAPDCRKTGIALGGNDVRKWVLDARCSGLGTWIGPVRNRVGNCISSGWRIVLRKVAA